MEAVAIMDDSFLKGIRHPHWNALLFAQKGRSANDFEFNYVGARLSPNGLRPLSHSGHIRCSDQLISERGIAG